MLLFLMIPLLGLTAIVADIIHYHHLRRRKPGPHLFAALWYALTDAIPVAITAAGFLLNDNSTLFMSLTMCGLWFWMATVLPRLTVYFFDVLRLRRTGRVLAICLAAVLVWGATLGRTTIRVNRVEICSERLPVGFDGMRIVQLSDIHLGTLVCPKRELTRIADKVNALDPELVVFTGDLVNIRFTELDRRMVRLLQRIEAPVVSVTGNHDVGAYIKDTLSLTPEANLTALIAAQRAMGWRVLDDETVYLHRDGDSISLSGISYDPDIQKRRHDNDIEASNLDAVYRDVPDSLFNITAVHLPQLWDQIRKAGYGDLTLAGHVHSMQMKIDLFGWRWSPAAWIYDRWSGRYDVDGRTLYINDGTGYVAYPMRLGAWPEVTLFTLRHCAVANTTD